MKKYLIRLLGDPAVGKSALLTQVRIRMFLDAYLPHNGPNNYLTDTVSTIVTLPESDEAVEFLLDGGGKSINPSRSDAILLVFALDDPTSFNNLEAYLADHQPQADTPIFVVGCKSDLKKRSSKHYEEKAESQDRPYWEVSAKNNTHVNELLQHVAYRLTHKRHTTRNDFLKTLDDARKKQAAEQKNAYENELDKEYRIILEKLNPKEINKEQAYQHFEDISKDIERINKLTQQIEGDSYHSQRARAEIRTALEHAINRFEEPLFDKWHSNTPALAQELVALNDIKNNLHIIQPKASQHNKPKSAMIKVEKLIEILNDLHKLALMKNELEAPDVVAQPGKAMIFLSQVNITGKDTLRNLVNKHLMQPITVEKQGELADIMKQLSKAEKERLKKNLIRATKNEILDSTPNYRLLLADKDKKASLIPLIAILRISGSGKINQKTDSYTAWLTFMNKSKPVTTKNKVQTFQEDGAVGVISQARTDKKADELKPGGKKREDFENKNFDL